MPEMLGLFVNTLIADKIILLIIGRFLHHQFKRSYLRKKMFSESSIPSLKPT